MIFGTILIAALLTIVNGSNPVLIGICPECCKVCGEGKKVGLPDKLFFEPTGVTTGYSHYTCAEMEWEASQEVLATSGFCDILQYRAPLRCGCKAGTIPQPTRKPTRVPTRHPTRLPTRKKPTPMPTKGKKPK